MGKKRGISTELNIEGSPLAAKCRILVGLSSWEKYVFVTSLAPDTAISWNHCISGCGFFFVASQSLLYATAVNLFVNIGLLNIQMTPHTATKMFCIYVKAYTLLPS